MGQLSEEGGTHVQTNSQDFGRWLPQPLKDKPVRGRSHSDGCLLHSQYADDSDTPPQFHDVWAGVLLIGVLLGLISTSVWILYQWFEHHHQVLAELASGPSKHLHIGFRLMELLAYVVALAFCLSWVLLCILRRFTKTFVWLPIVLNGLIAAGVATYCLYRHMWIPAMVSGGLATFTIGFLVYCRSRMLFTEILLQQALIVANLPTIHVFWISSLGGLASLGLLVWTGVTLIGIFVVYGPSDISRLDRPSWLTGSGSAGTTAGLMLYVSFAALWLSEWIKNTVHTTVAGVYVDWFFSKPIPGEASWKSFKRTITYHLGSVSLGSLVASAVWVARVICSTCRGRATAAGSSAKKWSCSPCGCFTHCVSGLLQAMNKYAFSAIALTRQSYIDSAKSAVVVIRQCKIQALINDCMVDSVLSMGALAVACLSSLLALLYLELALPSKTGHNALTLSILAFAFLIALQISHTLTTPISSGVDTIFLAYAREPEKAEKDLVKLFSGSGGSEADAAGSRWQR